MHGWDVRVSTNLDFYLLPPCFPAIETNYAKKLLKEVKQARQLAQKAIRQAQKGQRYQYDKTAKEPSIEDDNVEGGA